MPGRDSQTSPRAEGHSPQPGDCTARCAACGRPVLVPPIGGLGPWLTHKAGCSRVGWPIEDAILDSEGEVVADG